MEWDIEEVKKNNRKLREIVLENLNKLFQISGKQLAFSKIFKGSLSKKLKDKYNY